MYDTPLVSVIIPVYNVEEWVEDAVSSIIDQTYRHMEIIIVDDGSTDNTMDIIRRLRDSRIHILTLNHQGLFHALNQGIQAAQGRYIARMDGDDISHPFRIEKQIQMIEDNPRTVICGTAQGYICPNRRVVWRRPEFEYRKLLSSRLTKGIIATDASMIFDRRAAIEVGLYDTDIPMNEKSLWYKLLTKGNGIEIGSCYYFTRIRDGSSNIGQLGGAQRGRAVRLRYDPKGYYEKYGDSDLPPAQILEMKGIRTKIWMFRASHDYSTALFIVLRGWKSQTLKSILYLLYVAITGRGNWRRSKSGEKKLGPDYIFYRPENPWVVDYLKRYKIDLETTG